MVCCIFCFRARKRNHKIKKKRKIGILFGIYFSQPEKYTFWDTFWDIPIDFSPYSHAERPFMGQKHMGRNSEKLKISSSGGYCKLSAPTKSHFFSFFRKIVNFCPRMPEKRAKGPPNSIFYETSRIMIIPDVVRKIFDFPQGGYLK